MKKPTFTTMFFLFFSVITFAETTIRITNGEWEPFVSEYSYQYGIDSHIVSEAFKLEGITVEWGFFPWKRSYQLAEDGQEWQASCCWWSRKETEEHFLISTPVSTTSFVFFHLKDFTFDWHSINDLGDLDIGVTLAYEYGDKWDSAVQEKNINVEYVPRDELNFQKLLHQRIQIFPNDPLVGLAQIRNNFTPEQAKRFTHHPKKFNQTTINLIISKKDKNSALFLEKFNAGLKKLEDSGRLAQMFKDLDDGKYDKQKQKWQSKANVPH